MAITCIVGCSCHSEKTGSKYRHVMHRAQASPLSWIVMRLVIWNSLLVRLLLDASASVTSYFCRWEVSSWMYKVCVIAGLASSPTALFLFTLRLSTLRSLILLVPGKRRLQEKNVILVNMIWCTRHYDGQPVHNRCGRLFFLFVPLHVTVWRVEKEGCYAGAQKVMGHHVVEF